MNILQLFSTWSIAQVETFFVQPMQTDPSYSSIEDSMAVSISTGLQVNKLFLFIGGTGSSSSTAYHALRLHSANLGFHFINLSYPNAVPAASLSNSTDSLAFDDYRQEICFGTALSDAVSVDSFNSINTRTLKLIQYLKTNYPLQNWGQYLSASSSIDWSKIIVGGHSQGAGHAAYLGKQFEVDRVLMFSGPNDYSDHYSNSANWLRAPGATAAASHFAYLSLNDEVVDFAKQFENLSGLGMLTNDDSTYVDNNLPPFGNSHFLYTTQSPGIMVLNHAVPVKFSAINSLVWTYMLTSPVTSSAKIIIDDLDISTFPNPTSSILYLKSANKISGKAINIRNGSGQIITTKYLTGSSPYQIDLSRFPIGVYFFTIENHSFRVIRK